MLHIVNGESTAGTLRQSTIEGEKISFRDALICGPTPSEVSADQWHRIRALHLSDYYGVDLGSCKKDLLEQERILQSYPIHEEIVLWFEYDLFCQVNLLYLLNWFAQVQLDHTQLSLINVGAFPGKEKFRGLGELSAAELASLFPARQRLTNTELDLGSSAWQAYRSTDPTAIERLLETDLTPLPFLRTSFQAHLQRFPSLQNGLGRIENKSLELINRGLHRFVDLFPKFGESEHIYGLGDFQFWISLKRLAQVSTPLVSVNGNGGIGKLNSDVLREIDFEITDTGRAVLSQEADFVRLNGIDHWLGGVHLAGRGKLWRWDSVSEALVRERRSMA